MIQGKDFGIACLVVGGFLFVISVVSMVACYVVKGDGCPYDMNPIVPWMLLTGAFGIAWGGMLLLRGDMPNPEIEKPL